MEEQQCTTCGAASLPACARSKLVHWRLVVSFLICAQPLWAAQIRAYWRSGPNLYEFGQRDLCKVQTRIWKMPKASDFHALRGGSCRLWEHSHRNNRSTTNTWRPVRWMASALNGPGTSVRSQGPRCWWYRLRITLEERHVDIHCWRLYRRCVAKWIRVCTF